MTRIIALTWLVLASFGSGGAAYAEGIQAWPTLSVNASLGGEWRGSVEGIGRTRAGYPNGQFESRFQAAYALNRRVTFGGGYVHVVSYPRTGSAVREDQIVEQLGLELGSIGRARFSGRVRLEQRFIEGSHDVSWRFRQQLRIAIPLRQRGPQLVGWTEVFVDLNHTDRVGQTLDQLRAFGGVSLPVAKRADLEVGYIRQYIHRPGGDTSVDAIPVTLTLRL